MTEFLNDSLYTPYGPAFVKQIKPSQPMPYKYPKSNAEYKERIDFVALKNPNKEYHFHKYEHIRDLQNELENKRAMKLEEDLNEAIEEEMIANELTKQKLEMLKISNYFKTGLFSLITNQLSSIITQNINQSMLKNDEQLLEFENIKSNISVIDNETVISLNHLLFHITCQIP